MKRMSEKRPGEIQRDAEKNMKENSEKEKNVI